MSGTASRYTGEPGPSWRHHIIVVLPFFSRVDKLTLVQAIERFRRSLRVNELD
jgi:hypothetical protein